MKRYQDDFKASIVKMHREEKRSIRSLSEEYGVSPAAIHNWVKGAKSVELEDGTEVTSKEFKQLLTSCQVKCSWKRAKLN
ncbi:transposase [Lactiplantibacillus plantarum]|nr:transposase [Lactiplantibacillus plantarum]MCG0935956.1 transposase [Lactiplantibacillus plantarum]MCG0955152.1 transposase [Lactiplantibacillus plantarum]